MERIESKLLTINQVGQLTSLSKRTLWRLNASGKIPAPVRIGNSVRWRKSDIYRWIELGAPDRKRWEAMQRGK